MSLETKSGWLRTGLTVATMIGTAVAGYVAVIEQQNNNTKDIAMLAKAVERLEDDRRRDGDAISELKGDMKAIRQSIDFLVQSVRQHSFPTAPKQ